MNDYPPGPFAGRVYSCTSSASVADALVAGAPTAHDQRRPGTMIGAKAAGWSRVACEFRVNLRERAKGEA